MPKGTGSGRPPRQALVLSPGIIPTTDIYLRGRLEARLGEAVRYVDVLKTSPNELTLGEDVLVVVVRHAPSRWLRWLEGQKSGLAGVVYLMDDDIPAAACTRELPFRYALKTGLALCACPPASGPAVQRGVGIHAGAGETLRAVVA